MVVAQKKVKKKRPNRRILIAVGAAVLLAILLLTVFKSQGSQVGNIMKTNTDLQSKVNDLEKQLIQQKEAKRLEQRMQQQNQPALATQQKNTLSVVVAKRPIDAGTRLESIDLEIKEWPQEAVPLNAANYPESLIGRITSSDVASGEPILPNKLIDKDTQTLAIPEGYRAMTIPINNISGVGGFINPGARVDLITVVPKATGASTEEKTEEKISKILLQNVKVLATSGKGGDLSKAAKKPTDAPTSTITIAVPAEDAVKLALAFDNGNGNIQIILRGFQDEAHVKKTVMDTAELLTGRMGGQDMVTLPEIELPKPPTETNYAPGANMNLNSILSDANGLPPPEPPTAQTKTHSIEVIQANSRQEVSFETEI